MAASLKPHVFAEDMSEEDVNKIVDYAAEVFVSPVSAQTQFPHFAQQIRAMADKEFGPGWCCVVGQRYGAFVTHATKQYLYFRLAKNVNVLLWKC